MYASPMCNVRAFFPAVQSDREALLPNPSVFLFANIRLPQQVSKLGKPVDKLLHCVMNCCTEFVFQRIMHISGVGQAASCVSVRLTLTVKLHRPAFSHLV